MHNFTHGDTFFNFNSDWSGNVIIRRGTGEVQIPFDAIQAFMAEHLRRESNYALEDRENAGEQSQRCPGQPTEHRWQRTPAGNDWCPDCNQHRSPPQPEGN